MKDDRRTIAVNLSRRWVDSVRLAAIVALLYLLCNVTALALRFKGVSVFYPAAGISAGVLIALGPLARWPVSAAVIVAKLILRIFLLGQNPLGISGISNR
jgi:hypothetical protein